MSTPMSDDEFLREFSLAKEEVKSWPIEWQRAARTTGVLARPPRASASRLENSPKEKTQ